MNFSPAARNSNAQSSQVRVTFPSRAVEAKVDTSTQLEMKDIREAFDAYDLDKSGSINKLKLRKLFDSLNMNVDDSLLDIMIQMADLSGDGEVRFDEFFTLLRNPSILLDSFETRRKVVEVPSPDASPVPIPTTTDSPPLLPPKLSVSELFKQVLGKETLRPSDVKQLYRQFQQFDMDKSGQLDFREFHELVGISKPKQIVKDLFRAVDTDDSGRIDMKEFLVALTSMTSSEPLEKLRLSFALFDDNGNGILEPHELRSLVTATCLVAEGATDIEARIVEIYRQLLPDFNSGQKPPDVSFQDFIRIAKLRPDLLSITAVVSDASPKLAMKRNMSRINI